MGCREVARKQHLLLAWPAVCGRGFLAPDISWLVTLGKAVGPDGLGRVLAEMQRPQPVAVSFVR